MKIIRLVSESRLKKAIIAHERLSGGSATEKNIEGCIYALSGKNKAAIKCFMQSLLLDKGNSQAIYFMSSLNEIGFLDKIKLIFKGFAK